MLQLGDSSYHRLKYQQQLTDSRTAKDYTQQSGESNTNVEMSLWQFLIAWHSITTKDGARRDDARSLSKKRSHHRTTSIPDSKISVRLRPKYPGNERTTMSEDVSRLVRSKTLIALWLLAGNHKMTLPSSSLSHIDSFTPWFRHGWYHL